MLEVAHLVVPRLDRAISGLDQSASVGRQSVVRERILILGLDMILAALDFGDDGIVVALGDSGLEVDERAVTRGKDGAVVLGIATKPGDFGAKLLGDRAAFAGAGGEQFGEARTLNVGGARAIAVDAVDRRRDQPVERADVMAGLGHGEITPAN